MHSVNRWNNKRCIVSLLLAVIVMLLSGCSADLATGSNVSGDTAGTIGTGEMDRVFYAHVNGSILPILASDNSSADALWELLKTGDVTIDMHDYGSFEKVGALPWELPRNDTQITTKPGDVILYQGNQITIYYDENSWSFTRLARIDSTTKEELLAALGDGDVSVKFSLEWGE